MQQAMHAAKLAVLQMAMQSLVVDAQDDPVSPSVDGVSVHLVDGALDIIYLKDGKPVGGEGV